MGGGVSIGECPFVILSVLYKAAITHLNYRLPHLITLKPCLISSARTGFSPSGSSTRPETICRALGTTRLRSAFGQNSHFFRSAYRSTVRRTLAQANHDFRFEDPVRRAGKLARECAQVSPTLEATLTRSHAPGASLALLQRVARPAPEGRARMVSRSRSPQGDGSLAAPQPSDV